MSESLAFKKRPSLGHGLLLLFLLLIETDYKTSLSRVESLSEAINKPVSQTWPLFKC